MTLYDDCSVVALQMGSARTATHPVSPALDRRRTNVQNVQKVCHWFIVFKLFQTSAACCLSSELTMMTFIFCHLSFRAIFDHAANMCVKVSGGLHCQSAERCVRGVPCRLFAVCGRSALHPLPECSQSSVVPTGWAVCSRVCEVRRSILLLLSSKCHTRCLRHVFWRAKNKCQKMPVILTFPTWCSIKFFMYLKPEPYIDLAEAPSYEASFKLSDHVTFFYYLLSGLLYQYMLFLHGLQQEQSE